MACMRPGEQRAVRGRTGGRGAGITTGYQEKPCLDPTDPECPETAPNKHSKEESQGAGREECNSIYTSKSFIVLCSSPPSTTPWPAAEVFQEAARTPINAFFSLSFFPFAYCHKLDVGAELTGGCYGYAGKFMHWPEDLIVGGAQTNKTGHIVRAEALQSMVQLMGSKNLYESTTTSTTASTTSTGHRRRRTSCWRPGNRSSRSLKHISVIDDTKVAAVLWYAGMCVGSDRWRRWSHTSPEIPERPVWAGGGQRSSRGQGGLGCVLPHPPPFKDQLGYHMSLLAPSDPEPLVALPFRRPGSEPLEVLAETERLQNETRRYNMLPFSSATLGYLLRDFSEVPAFRVALGYIFMVIYACLSLAKLSDSVRSAAGLGLAGVLLVAITVAAGLGLCALLGLPFNASTTQVLPFLALGLGVDDMFLMAHTFAETADNSLIPYQVSGGRPLVSFLASFAGGRAPFRPGCGRRLAAALL
ncbi:putative hedgehog receptor patched [Penaeus vannamei]|uniref:Putative hedgehog receptor patched n=1 Tax=Penaeus vannamei TaxID=6689 RepID=A0A3R7LS64_PENVA|nr:putative hedgehog receptor patched [Penaeus vannamei]